MDVDVQRYYLIQVPLRRDAGGVSLSNMGTPPFRGFGAIGGGIDFEGVLKDKALSKPSAESADEYRREATTRGGFDRVAIGHGNDEGVYGYGSGFYGARAEEPVRVTVVYFVTPVGEVTEADMQGFSSAFAKWDEQAIWGGSFVVKE
jgi:hypothetical protein